MNARDPGFANRLAARVRGEVRQSEPLSRYSTYRIGGPATVLLAADPTDVEAALALATDEGVRWLVLGLG